MLARCTGADKVVESRCQNFDAKLCIRWWWKVERLIFGCFAPDLEDRSLNHDELSMKGMERVVCVDFDVYDTAR